jgi:sugar/nucleoside kinase (ribokinase family)
MVRNGIVLSGTVILDIVNIVDHWPEEEQVAFIMRTEHGAGGPPHNAAAGLKKLGATFPVTCIGVVGDDEYGRVLCAQAVSYGLATDHFQTLTGAVTSHTQVMSSSNTGRRTFFHYPGVSHLLTPAMLLPKHDAAKIFYLGSPGIAKKMDDSNGWVQVLKSAQACGFETALELVPVDAAILQRLVPPCLAHVDVLVVNDHEAAAVTGIAVTLGDTLNVEAAQRACAKLFEIGVAKLVCIHHPQGAVGMLRTGEICVSGSVQIAPSEIIGSVGAGDAFYAGVLFGWHENWTLKQCLELANAAAATSLFSATTSASILSAEQCLEFAQTRGLHNL